MVHALERARRQLVRDGVLICIQPSRAKRPFIAVRAKGQRTPVGFLVNPAFQPLIDAAELAIANVLDRRLVALIGKENRQYRVRLANPSQLRRYFHDRLPPPRFPAGGKRALLKVWRSSPEDATVEVTEFLTAFGMRVS